SPLAAWISGEGHPKPQTGRDCASTRQASCELAHSWLPTEWGSRGRGSSRGRAAPSTPMDQRQVVSENYANPITCFFHVLFKAASLAFYILFSLFVKSFVIIFVITVLLAALDFWVVKNVSGRILVGLRWWNEIDDEGNSVWKFECLDGESLARMNKKDSWLFWWTLYLTAAAWIVLGIFSLIRLEADYLLVVGVCLSLSVANIVGFTKCNKDAKKNIQAFAQNALASRVTSSLQSAFGVI
ncbi:unnamed protein product, partial [Urochloa humidicola]